MTADLTPCGTRAGYARHKRRREAACAPCGEAERNDSRVRAVVYTRAEGRLRAEYTVLFAELCAEEKAADPDRYRENARAYAHRRAVGRLRRMHASRYVEILAEEKATS